MTNKQQTNSKQVPIKVLVSGEITASSKVELNEPLEDYEYESRKLLADDQREHGE